MKPILLSGIQPSGPLHIGNYLGALKNFVALQNSGKYDCFFFVPDYHALTEPTGKKEQRKRIFGLMLDYLAVGLNPKKSTLFIQSHIPEHTELAWVLSTTISVGELERMTQFKDKTARGLSPNAGLFNYPTLMAADILIYKASVVPVGSDQDQHLEIARTFASSFNKRFGKTFPEPKPAHTNTPKILSIKNPERKMSKSDRLGCLFIGDNPKTIKEKIVGAVTDSYKTVGYDPKNRPGISNLLSIYAELSDLSIQETANKFQNSGYVEFKSALADLIIKYFAPYRKRRRELLKEKDPLVKVFADGSARARKIAQATLVEVKEKIGLI